MVKTNSVTESRGKRSAEDVVSRQAIDSIHRDQAVDLINPLKAEFCLAPGQEVIFRGYMLQQCRDTQD